MNKKIHLILSALVFALAACGTKPTPTPQPAPTGTFDVTKFTGVYEGAWTNETAGTSGPATITIEADEATKTATLTLDFGGNYLGLNDPPAATISTIYDDNGAHLTGDNALFGTMDVLLDADGNITGTFENLAGGLIPAMSYTGKIGDGRLDANYTVTLSDGSTTIAKLETAKK